jgi:hypothetical protein
MVDSRRGGRGGIAGRGAGAEAGAEIEIGGIR